jgi:4a-hydroxytetrahydrobiopterin dehydratase
MEEYAMTVDLANKHCAPCEGGVPPVDAETLRDYLGRLSGWQLVESGRRIRRSWRVKDFPTALDYFRRIGDLAEAENHHPDLHLTNYRDVAIEIWTHAIGGLSENDFILAAKIDRLPVELKQ